jgi:TrbL/VirB6 plasmid conjugal transfer protein
MSGKRRSVMSRGLWLLGALPIAAWALFTLLPTSVAAQTQTCDTACMLQALGVTPGPSVGALGWFDPTSQIATLVSGWLPTLQGMARNLFGALFVIELFMIGFQTILFRDNLGELISGVTFKVFAAGFFIWVMTDSSYLFSQIIGSFRQAGQMASGTSGSTLSTLYKEEVAAVLLYATGWVAAVTGGVASAPLCQDSTACVSAVGMLAQMSAYLCGAMVILIFSSLMLLSLTYIMITIETFIVMCGGVLFVGFAGSRFTMPFSQGYLRYAVNVGMKIYVFWLVIAIAASLMPGIIANAGITGGLTAIGGGIAAIATTDAAADQAGKLAAKATKGGAAVAADGTDLGAEAGIGAAGTAGSVMVAGSGDPGAGDAGITMAPINAQLTKDTSDLASERPSIAARAAAIVASVAASRPALVTAVTAAVMGLITGTFGALQIIMLNSLVSAAPGFVQSMTEGSSTLSAQQTLKAMESTFTQAGLATKALSSKISSTFLENARPKEENKEKKSESPQAADKTATIAPSSQRKETFQLPTKPSVGTPSAGGTVPPTAVAGTAPGGIVLPTVGPGTTSVGNPALPTMGAGNTRPVGSTALPTVGSGTTPVENTALPTVGVGTTPVGSSGQPPVGVFPAGLVRQPQRPTAVAGATPGQVPSFAASTNSASESSEQAASHPLSLQDQMAQEAIAFYKHTREQRLKDLLHRKVEEAGLASLSDAERDALSPLRQAQGLASIVNREQPMTPDVKRWINSSPNTVRLYRKILLQKADRKAREDNSRGLLQLALLDGALSGSTQSANEGRSGPNLGGSGINT